MGWVAVDYTAAVAAEGPITVQRALNKPSRCTAEIVLGAGGLAVPVRRGRVTVTAVDGTVLFTGYLATEPVRIYAGNASTGAVYRARVTAVSDEWLLDNLGSGAGLRDTQALGLDGAALVARLAARAQAGGSAGVTVMAGATVATTGAFAARASVPWSENAGECGGVGVCGVSRAEWTGADSAGGYGDACVERCEWDAVGGRVADQRGARVGKRCDAVWRGRTGGLYQRELRGRWDDDDLHVE